MRDERANVWLWRPNSREAGTDRVQRRLTARANRRLAFAAPTLRDLRVNLCSAS